MLNRKKYLSLLGSLVLTTGTFFVAAPPAMAFTSTDADTAFNDFNNAFYTGSGSDYYYWSDTSHSSYSAFWTTAELIEMVEDAYERSGSSTYKGMITQLCNGFIAQHGTDWSSNSYNDDIIWACIAFTRAYEDVGNANFLTDAKNNFNTVWSRAYDTTLGGGLWWTTGKTSKNTCVNAPAAIEAYKLSADLNNSTYLNHANSLFSWVKSTLYNSSTGSVYDNISSSGVVDQTNYTYNEGTFIGAANYLNDTTNATLALNYVKNNMTVGGPAGILKSERATSDQGGFKGIFWRWACKYVNQRGLGSTYNSWFQENANLGWINRDISNNLKDENIMSVTDSGGSTTLNSWWCSSQVVLMQDCTPGGSVPAHMTFYQDANYGGAAFTLLQGDYSDMTPTGIPNDWMSSLQDPNGWTISVYQNGGFGGTLWTFTGSSSYVGSACNDQMSSFKIH